MTLRCQPRARRRPSGSRPTPTRSTAAPRCTGRRASRGTARATHVLLEGVAADVDARARAVGAPTARAPAGAARRPAPRPRSRSRPAALARARAPRSTRHRRALAGRGRRRARCTSRPTTQPRSPRLAASADAARRLAAPRGRRARPRRLRRAAAEPGAHARGSAPRSTRPASCSPGRVPADRPMTDASTTPSTPRRERRPAGRRGRARRVRRVRAVPPALPDVPGHRPRDRVAARPHRRHARGRVDGAPIDDAFRAHDGDVRAVPRLRGRVPVGRAVRPPDGGHARRARARGAAPRVRARAASASGSRSRWCCRATGCCSRSPGCSGSAQRLHLVPTRFGLPTLSAAVAAHAARRRRRTRDAYLFTGCVMDAWQRDVHRAALRGHARDRRARRAPGRGGDCCGALHIHAGRIARGARGWPGASSRRCPGDAPVVVDSAGCGAAMKDYGRLLGTPRGARVRGPGRRLLRVARGATAPRRCRDTGATVVVQDPCHLRHVQKAHGAVRTVLAPAYRAARDRRRRPVLRRRRRLLRARARARRARSATARSTRSARAAARDDPLVVVSANPGCAMHLARGRPRRPPPGRAARRRTRPERPPMADAEPSSSGCGRSRRSCATSPTSGCARAAEDGDAGARPTRSASCRPGAPSSAPSTRSAGSAESGVSARAASIRIRGRRR